MCDAFIAEVSADGKSIDCAGFIGGNSHDYATFVSIDGLGNAFFGGDTSSTESTFPVKNGPRLVFSPKGGNSQDAFVCRVRFVELSASGATRPGGKVDYLIRETDSAGLAYQLGTSLGTGPVAIGSRQLHLSPDGLLSVSVSGLWPWIFSGFSGVVGGNGLAGATLQIPNSAPLIGTRIHSAFVTLDAHAPEGIQSISNTVTLAIAK